MNIILLLFVFIIMVIKKKSGITLLPTKPQRVRLKQALYSKEMLEDEG